MYVCVGGQGCWVALAWIVRANPVRASASVGVCTHPLCDPLHKADSINVGSITFRTSAEIISMFMGQHTVLCLREMYVLVPIIYDNASVSCSRTQMHITHTHTRARRRIRHHLKDDDDHHTHTLLVFSAAFYHQHKMRYTHTHTHLTYD